MKDLTQGSIPKHIIHMALPIAVGMFVQTLYYLVDLYFVGNLGEVALAGVSAAGNMTFLIIALTQILGVGTVSLISHAVGRKDKEDANLIFNQSLVLSLLFGIFTLLAGYGFAAIYMKTIAASEETFIAGMDYLNWFIPCMALQFALVATGSALRGTGIVKPTMLVQMLTVIINIILAPVLIAGWGTGMPMGVAGAGLASTIAVAIGVVLMFVYFHRLEKYVSFNRQLWRPDFTSWKKILAIGFPAGGEFILLFFFMGVIYWVIRDFGSAAQAGFGLGSRIMQAFFLPALAISFSIPAIAGQNYGAKMSERVRDTFKWATIMNCIIMSTLLFVIQWQPEWMVEGFSNDTKVIGYGTTFLLMISWNFIPSGLIFTCSGMFQSFANTWPSLISTSTRLITFVIPAVWLSQQSGFQIETVWKLSVATVIVQAFVSMWLMRHQFEKRLVFENM